jgi:hypothetical protein
VAFLSANSWICERALREADGVVSAIRIVDVFMTSVRPEVPVEQQVVPMTLLAVIRLSPDDDGNHTVETVLVRPDGERATQQIFAGPVSIGRFPELSRTIWAMVHMGVVPRQFGTHRVVVRFDNEEVTTSEFTLLEAPLDQQTANVLVMQP